jgi:hypothetical protein
MSKEKKLKKKVGKLSAEVENLKNKLELNEEMCELINNTKDLNLQRTEFHLQQVKLTTGEILMEDVTYCINLSKRIIDYLKRG